MKKRFARRSAGISWTILFCIGIVSIFSFTARFLGGLLVHSSPSNQALYHDFFGGTIAEAATASKKTAVSAVDAKKLILSAKSLSLAPLEKKTFEIGYKNVGLLPWKKDSSSTSVIVLRSSARKESYFYDPSWKSPIVIGALPNDTQSGGVVFFRFTLEAPRKQGLYTETLSLYQGSKKLPSSDVKLPIEVVGQTAANASMDSLHQSDTPVVLASVGPQQFLEAQKLIQSATVLHMEAGSTTVFEVGYKNSGKRAWRVDDMPKVTLQLDAGDKNIFSDPSWYRPFIPSALSVDTLSGQVAYFRFLIRAPQVAGSYRADFYLAFGDDRIVGSSFSLPIEVAGIPKSVSVPIKVIQPSENTVLPAQTPADTHVPLQPTPATSETVLTSISETQVPQPQPSIVDDRQETEPTIRIGYFSSNDPVRIVGSLAYEIRDGTSTLLSSVSAGNSVEVAFDFITKTYTISAPSGTSTLQAYPRFTSPDPNIVFEIVSYSNRPAWSSSINDNKLRGAVEVRYSEKTKKVWLINELPLEYYLRGIAETSNSSPYEFQKALIVAARTYAKYHIDTNTKYAGEFFTIRATDFDQVYRGYGAEVRLPNVTRAVEETRGLIVFYQGSLAITPYYSQSDGRTRSWQEVWAGSPKPWLVSKEDPAGRGLPLLGHGVGMPARGAISLALEGKTFEDILKYYYTGIELRKRY